LISHNAAGWFTSVSFACLHERDEWLFMGDKRPSLRSGGHFKWMITKSQYWRILISASSLPKSLAAMGGQGYSALAMVKSWSKTLVVMRH